MTPVDTQLDSVQVQLRLEKEALELGEQRYQKLLSQGDDNTRAGLALLWGLLDKAAPAVKAWVEDTLAGKAVRGKEAAMMVADADPRQLAFVALKVALGSISQDNYLPHTGAVMEVARLISASLVLEEVKDKHPGLWRKVSRKLRGSPEHYAVVTSKRLPKWTGEDGTGYVALRWTRAENYVLGASLLEIVAAVTGAFSIEMTLEGRIAHGKGGKKTKRVVIPNEMVVERLRKAHAVQALLAPVYGPMVCPPRQWSDCFNGGFLTKPLQRRLV